MIERIAKLLNKAENAGTPQEAHVYFEKAQALATTHSISLARARLTTSTTTRPATPINRTITIGAPRRHANRHLVRLFATVGAVNGLTVDVAHNSTYVIAYGFPDDIDSAELIWGRIATQMVRFGEEFLATDAWRGDTRIVLRRRRYVAAEMTRQTARSSYYGAFIDTIHLRLVAAHERAVAEEQTSHPGTATAVALRDRDQAVAEHYRTTSSARGSWHGGRSSVHARPGSATRAGRRDAHRVALGGGPEVTGPPASLPR